ncbi:MAG: hypothetical protein D6748_10915 [Calditrichaeota bacterium]|nr:MAG: hypothetical protein D6748_10915 [Calditrichota bacterium]
MTQQYSKDKNSIYAVIQLTRPVNALITFLSVWVAAIISGGFSVTSDVLLACLSAALIAGGANTLNDYFDIEIDRINKPERPLPAGKISPHSALTAAIVEFGFGIGLSIFISVPMLLLALTFSALLIWYSAHLKKTVIWGNLAVSLSTAAAFIYGGFSVRKPLEALIPALFAFFFHFGREIIKDIEDMKGDRQHHAITFPIRYGISAAIFLVWLNFLLLILLTLLPYWKGWYGPVYMSIVLFGIYPVLGYVLVKLVREPSSDQMGKLSTLLKADMIIGLIAIFFR